VARSLARTGQTLTNHTTGQSITFLELAADTGGERLVLKSTWKGRAPRPPVHYHPRQEEHFEVLEGELGVELEGERRTLRAGDTLDVPAGARHEMWNAGEGTTQARWEVRPALRTEEMMETVFGLAQDGHVDAKGMPSMLRIAPIALRHGQEFRLAKPPWAVQLPVLALLSPIARLRGYSGRYEPANR
jgi:mannose-6-phosphate isomerase-like protein (cupin superfamily)